MLPNSLVSEETGLDIAGTYNVYSENRDTLLNGLITESYWSELANGILGATATGGPTFELLMKSYNEKNKTNLDTNPKTATAITLNSLHSLYCPDITSHSDINVYWLTSIYQESSNYIWRIACKNGNIDYPHSGGSHAGVRPVVKLPSTTLGTVGETVEIK